MKAQKIIKSIVRTQISTLQWVFTPLYHTPVLYFLATQVYISMFPRGCFDARRNRVSPARLMESAAAVANPATDARAATGRACAHSGTRTVRQRNARALLLA